MVKSSSWRSASSFFLHWTINTLGLDLKRIYVTQLVTLYNMWAMPYYSTGMELCNQNLLILWGVTLPVSCKIIRKFNNVGHSKIHLLATSWHTISCSIDSPMNQKINWIQHSTVITFCRVIYFQLDEWDEIKLRT